MTTFIVIMVLAVVVPVVAGIFCRRWAQNHRADQTARVKTVGQALGLSDRVSKSSLSGILREIPLFSLGRSHSILYALEGERNGVAITVFELHSYSGSSNSRSNSGVYVLMRSHQLQSPAFVLEPSDMHLGSAIAFDSHPQFARRFWLKGHRDNEAAVRNFFTPGLLDYLLEQSQRIRLWGSGPYLLYGGGINTFAQVTYSDKLQAFIDKGLGIYAQIVPVEAASREAARREAQRPASAAADVPVSPPATVSTQSDLQQAAAQLRSPKITQWNPLSVLNSGQEQQKQRIAALIVDLVAGGGTYKPSVSGMGATTYESRQGKIIYIFPSEDPREARMRGQEAGRSQREMSREGLQEIIQAGAENFFPVLNPEKGDRVDRAMAEQLLAAIEDRGSLNLTSDAYKISIEPTNDRFIYQCDVPTSRHKYQYERVRRSLNRADARRWLMEHDRHVFADWLAASPDAT